MTNRRRTSHNYQTDPIGPPSDPMKKRLTKKIVQTEMSDKEYQVFARLAKAQGLTVKEALRRAVLLLVFQEHGIDPRGPRFDIGLRRRKATRNMDLFPSGLQLHRHNLRRVEPWAEEGQSPGQEEGAGPRAKILLAE